MANQNTTLTPEECRRRRVALGLTQSALAFEASISRGAVAHFEQGRSSGDKYPLNNFREYSEGRLGAGRIDPAARYRTIKRNIINALARIESERA